MEWFCCNCSRPTELNIHLRCSMCDSDEVAPTPATLPDPVPTVEQAIAEALQEVLKNEQYF